MIQIRDAHEGSVPAAASEPQPVPVSVVIVNYNAREVLADCLRSVLPQAPRSWSSTTPRRRMLSSP